MKPTRNRTANAQCKADSDELAAKLENLVSDAVLNRALGSYMSQLIVPGLLAHGLLSEDQACRVLDANRRTIEQIADPRLSAQAGELLKMRGETKSIFGQP